MKISIIVPLYNKEKYIEECVNSILNQTINDIEIIIVDDGSTDKSFEIAKKLQNTDNRIKLYSKKNGGLSSARNFGIEKSTGEYIGFVDSDDTIETNMYELLYNNAKQYKCDIVMCSYMFVTKSKKVKDNRLECIDENLISNKDVEYIIDNLLQMKIDTGVCIKLFKSELLKSNNIYFNENLKLSEDYPFVISTYISAKNSFFINKPLYNYMQDDDDSLSRSYNYKKVNQLIDVYKEICNILDKNNLKRQVKCDIWLLNNIRFITSLLSKKYKHNYQTMKEELVKINENTELMNIFNKIKYSDLVYIKSSMRLKISNLILLFLMKRNGMHIYSILRRINNFMKLGGK